MTLPPSRWEFDKPLSTTASTQSFLCTDRLRPGKRFFAKRFVGDVTSEAMPYFARQAAISTQLKATGLLPLVWSDLDAEQPLLIYPLRDCQRLDNWLLQQSQVPPGSLLLRFVRMFLQTLDRIHSQGYMHGNVRPEHFLVDGQHGVWLVGLGGCEVVGTPIHLTRSSTQYDAPELVRGTVEASSAADIYSVGVMLCDLAGVSLSRNTIVQAMLAENPEDRPSAGQLVPLFLDIESAIFRRDIAANEPSVAVA